MHHNILKQLLLVLAFFITVTLASRKEKNRDFRNTQRFHVTEHPLLNDSHDYYSENDDTEKWNQLRDEVEEHWKGFSSNKHLFEVEKSKQRTSKPRKKKESNKNISRKKPTKRKAVAHDDYYDDYEEQEKELPQTKDMIHKFVPYLLQKYRPKRLHLYTNRKVDLDPSDSRISSSVEDGLNTGRFPGDPRYSGPLTPKDVIGKISTIPRRPCHGPACHEHHKGLVRFYWRRVIFPRNRTRTRERGNDEDDEDYDDNDERTNLRQRNRGRRRNRRRNRNRGRNRSRENQQQQSRGDNDNDYDNDDDDNDDEEEDNRRIRNQSRTNKRRRNRVRNRNRQRVRNRSEVQDYNEANTQVYKDRIDHEEDR